MRAMIEKEGISLTLGVILGGLTLTFLVGLAFWGDYHRIPSNVASVNQSAQQ
jgi:hypothetical protein